LRGGVEAGVEEETYEALDAKRTHALAPRIG